MAKKLLQRTIYSLFSQVKDSILWKRFERLPFLIRIAFGIVFILFGILGIFTPIPFGAVFFILGLALLFGLKRTQYYILLFIHFTRLHILYGKIYMWWKRK